MQSAATEKRLFSDGVARLTCIGGGPGSDILGTLRYLQVMASTEKVEKLVCHLLDREQAWEDTWTEVENHLDTCIALNTNFQPLDVTNVASWQSQKEFLQADVFTLSYFVSEVKVLDVHGAVSAFWKTLFAEAKSGAIFVYNDNGGGKFASYFDEFWKAEKLKPLLVKDNAVMTASGIKQSSELAFYSSKLNHSPKLKAKVSYRVLQKP